MDTGRDADAARSAAAALLDAQGWQQLSVQLGLVVIGGR